jgi:hypothetical protein
MLIHRITPSKALIATNCVKHPGAETIHEPQNLAPARFVLANPSTFMLYLPREIEWIDIIMYIFCGRRRTKSFTWDTREMYRSVLRSTIAGMFDQLKIDDL